MSSLHRIAGVALCLSLGACCKESLDARLFAGHKTAGDCRDLAKSGKESPITIVCPGEEVTLCWVAGNVQQVTVTTPAGATVEPAIGAKSFVPQSSMDIDIKASDCAEQKKHVEVLTQPEQFTFDAGWDCSLIWFTLDPAFVSSKVWATDIMANWAPSVPDTNGNPLACTTPPFLNGFHPQDLFGFQIQNPFITTTFSKKLHADGDYKFTPKFTCPAPGPDQIRTCNPYATFPFVITLSCG
jgi:hypothetical protein